VNRADLMQRQGLYPPPTGAPAWPGLEVSGRIRSVAPGITSWRAGDEVCALLSGGGYAEVVAVPAAQVLAVPSTVGLVSAAALPEVACTVWSNVFDVAGLSESETLLVHGGGSGIGTFAIQLAKVLGSRVIATCGTQRKLDACLALGADHAINYREQDFVEVVRDLTDGRGADVILDVVGAKYLAQNVAALAIHGRLVVIGMQGGARADLDLRTLMSKRGAIHATTLRARPSGEKAAIVASVAENVWPLVESSRIRPVVDRVLPWDQAAVAHQVMEAGENIGKVLLEVTPAVT
jgi:putative PIG3 family NAD(P)H quinone oxidoreductase